MKTTKDYQLSEARNIVAYYKSVFGVDYSARLFHYRVGQALNDFIEDLLTEIQEQRNKPVSKTVAP